MTIHLVIICETDKANLYQLANGTVFWLPTTAIRNSVKGLERHIVSIDDQWWEEHKKELKVE